MAGMLKGRVAVVTGSGRGLGRAYAMAIAQEGARVVINDLGCEPDGTGSSHLPADQVAAEINQAGGVAVANYDSVTTSAGADRIIKTAVDHFGRLDILVNNAGILRDNLVFDMTDEDFDLVLKTHLYGTFYCTRAASRIMKEQRYGRIVNISSTAGFGDLTGEINYAAAKEGIATMTRTISRDLVKFGITCNAIRPGANTRLGPSSMEQRTKIGKILGEPYDSTSEAYGSPEDIAPLVAYLVSEQAKNISNCIFEIHANYIAIYDDPPPHKVQTLIKREGRFTVDEVSKLLPQTLTKNVQLPIPLILPKIEYMKNKFDTNAEGWLWEDGKLNKVAPN
jgi:NAD(P)-dependent dehydrogenase (short-subunit alcohol dehydrogenase family)